MEKNRRGKGNLREGPGLRHYGEAHLVTSKQPGSALPCHGTKLDLMFVILVDQRVDNVCCAFVVGVLCFGVVDLGMDLDDLFCLIVGHGGGVGVEISSGLELQW